jgi:hypothetical protein
MENEMETIRIWPDVTLWISVRLAIVAAIAVPAGLWYAAISTLL